MAGAARNRTLERALLASLALHALVLFGFFTVKESANRRAAAPEPIAARLAEPEPAVPEAVLAPVVKSIAKKSISKTVIAEPAPAPAFEKPVEAKTTPPVATNAPASPPAEIASPPADATTVGQYRVQLIGAARRFKRYPEEARENNWTGNVVVAVAVGADGRPQTSVKTSSGRSVLDQQALEMFQQAARIVPIPPALRGKEFGLEVRAIYGLED